MDATNTITIESREERSLLLYLETRAVDYRGRIDTRHMNESDRNLANKWHEAGYIVYRRMLAEDLRRDCTHYVNLSEQAWCDAHKLRKERGQQNPYTRD